MNMSDYTHCTWIVIYGPNSKAYAAELTDAPFEGIQVVFRSIDRYENGYSFDWTIYQNPTELDNVALKENQDFLNVLSMVIDELVMYGQESLKVL